MAVDQTAQDYLLPCGRSVEDLWERLDDADPDRVDTHPESCAHCRDTRASLLALRDATGELVRDTAEPSRDLTSRIMAAVRADVRRRDLLAMPTAEPGRVQISEQAVAAVLRFAADSVPGVRARRCRVTQVGAEGEVQVELNIAVSYGGDALRSLDLVRERVAAAASARIGLILGAVHLTVDDFYDR